MKRFCYFCRKPLGIEKRAEMFCGLRCQKLYAQLGQGPPGPERISVQSPDHTGQRRLGGKQRPRRRAGRPNL